MNPILVDPRTGSVELYSVLSGNGVEIQLANEMPAGDFCFEGNGPNNSNLFIGVERKTVRDMLSCIRTGRFGGHQLPALCSMYQRYYLVLEGVYGCNEDGILEEPRGGGKWAPIELKGQRFMHSMLDRFLISIEEMSGIRVHRTFNIRDTARHVLNIWHMWNDKEYEKHRASSTSVATHVEIRPWSLKRKWAKDLPGVGVERSLAVDKHFNSAETMCKADVKQWAEIPGIGPGIANRIVDAIREERVNGTAKNSSNEN